MPVNSKQKGAEEWRPIIGYEGLYEVSDKGRVRSLPRATTKGKVLKLYKHPSNGYVYACLSRDNHRLNKRVHVLVANAFLGAKIFGYDTEKTVDHISGDKSDNSVSNLQVVSMADNLRKAHNDGTFVYAGTETICLDDMKVYKSYSDAAKAYGGSRGEMVRRVCEGKRSHYRNRHFCRLSDYKAKTIPTYTGKVKRKASESLWL